MGHRVNGAFYGWRVVAASFLINAISDGTFFIGFTVLFLPISRDLNLSRTAVSVPFALSRIIGGVLGPVVGVLVDRLGAGKVLAASAFIGGLGFILLQWTDSYALFLLVFLALLSVGMQSGFGAATSAAITQWFVRRRSLAMAVTQAGYSVGGGIIPPLLALGVQILDWRTTVMIAGLCVWAIALPLSTQLRKSPESMGLQPDGIPSLPAHASNHEASGLTSVSTVETGLNTSEEIPLGEALRTVTYWLLALSFGFRSMVWGAIGVHLVAIMVWKGLAESTSGYLVGVYAFAWTPAVLVMGWMGDRWSKQKIAGIGGFIGACGISLLLLWDQVGPWQMVLVLLLLSPNEAGWSLGWAMLGDFFGRRNFATLRGGMIALQSLMGVGSPLYSGWIYDTTGSYSLVILPAVVLIVASGLAVWFLPRPRRQLVTPAGGR